jgi:hypothetical protein
VGRPTQRYIQQQIPLTEKDALITFEVKEGRRQEELAAAQLEHLRDVQNELNGTVLAQIGGPFGGNVPGLGGVMPGGYDPDFMRDFYRNSLLARYARNNGLGRAPVGFMPVITPLPEGTMWSMAMAVISGDRRYVRFSNPPAFFGIGDVQTFNFVTGGVGAGGAGPGGFGGGGGGFGGGGFGGGAGGGGVF